MEIIWSALFGLLAIVGLIMFIVVVIKLFKTEGALKGILGIICGIYPFIWGWVKHKELKITRVMVLWTLCIVIPPVIGSMFLPSTLLTMVGSLKSINNVVKPPPAITREIPKRPGPEAISKPVKRPPDQVPGEKHPPKKPAIHDLEIKKLDDFIKQNSQNADAFYNRALLHEAKGNLQMAEDDYEKAIGINKEHVDAYYNRGLLFTKMKKFELAVKDFDTVIGLNPRAFDAYCNRGNANYQLGKKDLAIEDYNAALKITPNDADLFYNRAVAYQDKGVSSKANRDFKKAAALGHQKAKEYLLGQGKKEVETRARGKTSPVVWKKDLKNVKIPDTVPGGMIQGENFVSKSAEFSNGILTIRDGEDFFPDHAVMIFLFLKKDEKPEGKSYNISLTSGFGSPHIHMKWKPENSKVPKTKIFTKDYSMRLNLGTIKNGKLPGKIYLCLPDEMKSVVAGSFTAIVK
jgi:tetratricopeptide (TPR) repeat protein